MVEYTLLGVDGNAFAILGYVSDIMRKEGYSQEEISKYHTEASSKDYDHLVSISLDQIHQINLKKRGEQ